MVFGWSAMVAAAATGAFVLVNGMQSLGVCERVDNALQAAVMATLVWVLGFVIIPVVALVKFRGARISALAGWVAGLLPMLLLIMALRFYVQSLPPGCSG